MPEQSDGQVLIMDPYHPYAIRFIERCYREYGLQSVAFYTDPEQFTGEAWQFPELRGEMIAASYALPRSRVGDLVPVLKDQHNIVGVIPHNDLAITASEELAEGLGLDWAQPGVIDLFRNKFAFKEKIRNSPNAPRINSTADVADAADVKEALNNGNFDRFVLKPVDGYGNQQVGFFDRDVSAQTLDEYFAGYNDGSAIMEEYLDGREFWVNGQIDAHGNVTILAIFESLKQDMNGRDDVPVAHPLIHSTDPVFGPLADYAVAVMTASELKRSPFHMEVIVDDRGPCLVEVGPRMIGQHACPEMDEVHGPTFDVFSLATHYYLTSDDFGPIDLDWDHYNSREYRILLGTSSTNDRIYELSGIDDVEALPEFVHWIDKPKIGQRIRPRVDLFSSPWQLSIAGPTNAHLNAIENRIRDTIRWNNQSSGLRRKWRQGRAAQVVVHRKWEQKQRLYNRIPLLPVPSVAQTPVA